MLSLPPASHPAGDGRQPDTRSTCWLPLAWGTLLPQQTKDLRAGCVQETFRVVLGFFCSV